MTLQGTLLVSIHHGKLQFDAGAFLLFGDEIFASKYTIQMVLLIFSLEINSRFQELPVEWDLMALLEDLGEEAKFTPDYTVVITSDTRCLEWTVESYLVLRYLSQELFKCKKCRKGA